MTAPTRLRIQSYNIISAADSTGDNEAKNYVLLSLGADSIYFDWQYSGERAFGDIIKVDRTSTRGLIDVTINVEQHGRRQDFIFSVPFGWLQSAHMFSASQDGTSIFLIESIKNKFSSEEVYELENFNFQVNAVEPGSSLSERLFVVFQEVAEDRAIYNLSPKEYDNVRGDIMAIVTRLARGDREQLERVFTFMDAYDDLATRITDKHYEPTDEEKYLIFFRMHMARLLSYTHPMMFAPVGASSEQVIEHRETINIFEEIMQANGMNDAFEEVQLPAPKKVPGPDATSDERFRYVAAPTTQLPASMADFSDMLTDFAPLNRNWNGETPSNTIDEMIRDGGELVAACILVAVRLARIAEMSQTSTNTFHPTLMVQQGLSLEGEELPLWAIQQTHRLLGWNDAYPFEDFLLGNFPPDLSEEHLPHTLIAHVLHNFGHLLLRQEEGVLLPRTSFRTLPLMASFAENLFENAKEQEEDEEEGNDSPCPSMQAAFNLLRGFERTDIVVQLSQAYRIVAELSAYKNTELEAGTGEWHAYLADYLWEVAL